LIVFFVKLPIEFFYKSLTAIVKTPHYSTRCWLWHTAR